MIVGTLRASFLSLPAMKFILPFILLVVLSACGGHHPDDGTAANQTRVSRSHQANPVSPVAVLGERRSYDIALSGLNGLTGKSKVAMLPDFTVTGLQVRPQDISLTYDTDGTGGQLYRLYQAAFGRTPDVRGFGYWKNIVETGVFNLEQVAGAFLVSAESQVVYGAASDDTAFVARLYQNVLGRPGEASGVAFWAGALKAGAKRVDLLLAFAASAENKNVTAAAALAGMAFAEPGVAYIPVSNAKSPTDVAVGVSFEVDGSSSTDANDDKLSYEWSIFVSPAFSSAIFTAPAAAKPRLTLDRPGTYEVVMWARDANARSYSPARMTITAHALVADTGSVSCRSVDIATASFWYARGHTYLDRDKDGLACAAPDIAYENRPIITPVPDSGVYRCSTISHVLAVQLYQQGHTYLDRDHDGKPCESTDIAAETPIYVPPVVVPPTSGMCWVNGYRRANGTYVSGYWRRC